jgi:MFS family permease
MVGLPGLLVALVFWRTVREPPRGRWDPPGSSVPIALGEALRALASRRAFVFIALSAALHGFSSYGSGTWTNVFLMRVHGLNVAQAGLVLGLLTFTVAASGAYAAGRLTDALGRRDARWYMWIPAIASVAALPFVLLFLYLGDLMWAILAYVPGQLMVNAWVGPTYAMTQSVAPPSVRALAAAIVVFAINLVGMGLGPLVVGALNDAFAPRFGLEAVRYSLMIAAVPHTLAAVFNVLAARTLREDLKLATRPAAAHAP